MSDATHAVLLFAVAAIFVVVVIGGGVLFAVRTGGSANSESPASRPPDD
jgi:hypothetical protein